MRFQRNVSTKKQTRGLGAAVCRASALRAALGLIVLYLAGVSLVAGTGVWAEPQTNSIEAVRQGFLHPPADARPMVRWWWFGPAVQKPEILRELEQMKADGIGGAELAFVYPEVLDDPAKGLKNVAFNSPEMLDAVSYAQSEGKRLGLRIDVTLCSGWPYGGPHTPLQQAAGRLRVAEVVVPASGTTVNLPKLAEGETLISASLAMGAPTQWTAATAKDLPLQMPHDAGTVVVEPSQGPRVALFFIASHTRQQVKRAAVGAEGYVLDPFSKEAVATHLQKVGEPLLKAFGSTPPYAIFSDSLEAYGADWTPALPAEFKKRRGYDLLAHLPELWAGGTPEAAKVRHDYGRTLTELVDAHYLTQINDWAKAHGTRFRSQTYGEPAVSLASQRLVALPEGEGPQWRAFSTLRWAASANHLFGNNVTSGETYTWLHSPVFRATPLDMKAEADIDFIMGENQLIFHGWPYSPPMDGPGAVGEPESPWPGWSLYAAAVFNDHNPWHPVMPAVTAYLTRMSWLLRQGEPANQVAILLPTDDVWAGFAPGKVSVTAAMKELITPGLMSSILSAGYNVDFIDADTIDRLGIQHQILVIPPTDRIPLKTLKKIGAWVQGGGKGVGVERLPTMTDEGKPLTEAGGSTAFLPLVRDASMLGKAMKDLAAPDLTLTPGQETIPSHLQAVGYIRRKLADGDIYFLTNTSNEGLRMLATLGTTHAFGEEVDPDTGRRTAMWRNIQGRAAADLWLAPYESRVFLFSETAVKATAQSSGETQQIADLSAGWQVKFVATGKTEAMAELKDWMADPATLHYSGEAVYSREFTMDGAKGPVWLQVDGGQPEPGAPTELAQEHVTRGPDGLPNPLVTGTGPGMHAYFDPPIHEAALVVVNGQAAGALWHPPYRLDVTKFLKPGANHIEIHVYNTLLNAWSAQPRHDYGPLKAKYGDRFQMQDLDKVKPVASGLLGKVTLVEEAR